MDNWNSQFSTIIRQTKPTWWGNRGLNPQVIPGAVGFVDVATGDFRYVEELEDITLKEYPTSSTVHYPLSYC